MPQSTRFMRGGYRTKKHPVRHPVRHPLRRALAEFSVYGARLERFLVFLVTYRETAICSSRTQTSYATFCEEVCMATEDGATLAVENVTKGEARKVIFASSLGTVFEWYDFYLYAVLAPFFSRLFFPPGNDTAAMLAAFVTYAAGF